MCTLGNITPGDKKIDGISKFKKAIDQPYLMVVRPRIGIEKVH
jgi:hypothetical protein